MAARAPWRMAAAALSALGHNGDIPDHFPDESGAQMIAAMLARGINSPETSSAGRLFDAACGILGVKTHASYEGEAPMFLEALVTIPTVLGGGWQIDDTGQLSLLPLLDALRQMTPVEGANLFHGTVIAALVDWTVRAIDQQGLPRRALLSGGCLQNKVLAEGLVQGFAARGVDSYLPRQVPANDGGLSLGQAWVGAQHIISEEGQ